MNKENKQAYIQAGKRVGKYAMKETAKTFLKGTLLASVLAYTGWSYDQKTMNPYDWNWQEVIEQTSEGFRGQNSVETKDITNCLNEN